MKCAYFRKMCLFWDVEDFASKVQTLVLEFDFLFLIFEKKFLT